MKLLIGLFVTSAFLGNVALADNHTVSIGYAQSKLQDFKNIRGVNLQYRFEWDSPVSVVGSFSYMSGKNSLTTEVSEKKRNAKTYSFLVGPAYRFNEYVSLYGLLGLNHTKNDYNSKTYDYVVESTASSTNFAYGAGVIINPTENTSINVGYEGSRASEFDKNYSINGFTIGVGYRF